MECRYCKKAISIDESVNAPAMIKGVRGGRCCLECVDEIKLERIAFDESEQNCNTCKFLKRSQFKNNNGLLKGICLKTKENIKFYPQDCMDMDCYEHRLSGIAAGAN